MWCKSRYLRQRKPLSVTGRFTGELILISKDPLRLPGELHFFFDGIRIAAEQVGMADDGLFIIIAVDAGDGGYDFKAVSFVFFLPGDPFIV